MKRLVLIILALCFFSILNAQTTYTVGVGAGYDYDNIQDAVYDAYAITGSVSILVSDGEYDKFEINNNPPTLTELTVESVNGFENCIIDGDFDGTRISIIKSRNIIIEGFTIQNAVQLYDDDGHGVYVDSSYCVTISNCYFANNESANNGGGIYAYQDSSLTISNNIFYYNYASYAGGAMSIESSSYNIQDNIIENNNAALGGGINILGKGSSNIISSVRFNEIKENTASLGGGVFTSEASYLFQKNQILQNEAADAGGMYIHLYYSNDYYDFSYNLISCNIASHTGGAIYSVSSQIDISNCTITDNYCEDMGSTGGGIYRDHDTGLNLINSIIWGNDAEYGTQLYIGCDPSNVIITTITYSCIEGGLSGIEFQDPVWIYTLDYGNGNINADPIFVSTSPNSEDYCHLTIFSPCVDSGSPFFPYDPDDTLADMGCYYFHHDYDIHVLTKGYNWESFPKLDRYETINEETDIVPILNEITPFNFNYLAMETNDLDEEPELTYDGLYWDPEFFEIQSSWLCKIMATPEEERILTVRGSRLPADFELNSTNDPRFPLAEAEYHWLGYWLQESRNIQDALADYWEDVEKVKAEDWYYDRCTNNRGVGDPQPVSWSTVGKSMKYGKGYMIWFMEGTGWKNTFHWSNTGSAEEPEERPESEYFSYTEKPDYEVIDIVSIPENIIEIGVFQEEVCVGAVVVRDSCEQILVFSNYANREEIPFSFEIVTTNREQNLPIHNYSVYNRDSGEFEAGYIVAGRQESSIVRFGDINQPQNETPIIGKAVLHNNYPNPFNPETTISFSLPNDRKVVLTIYNPKGQKVRELVKGDFTAGEHTVTWEGKDDNGKQVGSGLYLYRLKTDKLELTKKMLLLK